MESRREGLHAVHILGGHCNGHLPLVPHLFGFYAGGSSYLYGMVLAHSRKRDRWTARGGQVDSDGRTVTNVAGTVIRQSRLSEPRGSKAMDSGGRMREEPSIDIQKMADEWLYSRHLGRFKVYTFQTFSICIWHESHANKAQSQPLQMHLDQKQCLHY